MKEPDPPEDGTQAPGTLSALIEELARSEATLPSEGGLAEPRPGERVGRFEVVRELGHGGFGKVYEAVDPTLERHVALKLVRPGTDRRRVGAPGPAEAQAISRLSHPNVVQLHEAFDSEFGPCLVFELLEGEPLSRRLERGPLAVAEAVRVALEVARGLAEAHRLGVVHRDLKPSNVFLTTNGQVKVLDFGLALVFGRRRPLEGGTPGWMSPEQIRGNPEDERTDVWALGAVLFKMLAGQVPSRATLAIRDAPQLVALIERAIATEPSARPRDAGEMVRELEPLVRDIEGRTRPAVTRVHRRWLRWALPLGGIAAVLGLMFLGLWLFVSRITQVRPSPAAGPANPLRVGVADMVNETGEPDLDVLSGLIVTSLEQTRDLTVMTRDRLLDLAAQVGIHASRVDEPLGRSICKANAIGTLILPAVTRLGSVYVVEARVIEPSADAPPFTVSERATTKESLLDALDRIAAAVARHLGANAVPGSKVPLGDMVTRNVEAYGHYLAGIEADQRDNNWTAAVREQLAAIALDPEFAAAQSKLGELYDEFALDSSVPRAVALRHLDRMPEKERLVILADNAATREDAIGAAEQLEGRFPEDKIAVAAAARAFFAAGQTDRARAAWARALKLDPAMLYPLWFHLDDVRGKRGRPTDESIAVCRRAVAVRRNAVTLVTLGLELVEAGKTQEATQLLLEALRVDEGKSASNACLATFGLIFLGRWRDALPLLDHFAVDENESWVERQGTLGAMAYGLLSEGRVREAQAPQDRDVLRQVPHDLKWLFQAGTVTSELGRARTDAPLDQVRARLVRDPWIRRNHLAWYGDIAGAAAADRTIAPEQRQRRASPGWFAEGVFQASRDVGERRFAKATRELEALASRLVTPGRGHILNLGESETVGAPDRWMFPTPTVGWHGVHALLAEALLGADDIESVARLSDRGREALPWSIFDIEVDLVDPPVNHPRVVIARAAALERLGRRPEARKDLEALVESWRDADHDLPLYVLARSRLFGLERPATSRAVPLDAFQRVNVDQRLRMATNDANAQGTPENLAWLAQAQEAAGASKKAIETAREALRLDDGTRVRSVDVACRVLEQEGLPSECVPPLERVVVKGRDGYERHSAKRRLAHLLALMGRVREAVALGRKDAYFEEPSVAAAGRWAREAAEIAAYHRGRTEVGDAITIGIAQELAWYGDLDGARRVYQRWKDAAGGAGDDRWYRAIMATHEHRYDEAIRLYRELVAIDDEIGVGTDRHCGLAEVLLAASRPEEAVGVRVPWAAWLENERHAGSAYPCLTMVRGRALKQLDRKIEAAAEVDKLLALWKQADPDLPLLIEAKALRSELGEGTAAQVH